MLGKTLLTLSLLATTVLSHSATAGETLDRVKHNGELIAVMDQSYPPYSFLNDKNEEGLTFLESFSGLLGKQYLFLQDDNTYYNRYTDEQLTAEEAEHWLYGELSSIIYRRD